MAREPVQNPTRPAEESFDPAAPGLVVRREGPQIWVEQGGREIPCLLRGRLRLEARRDTSPVVIGDRVLLSRRDQGDWVIEEILPRRSELARMGARGLRNVLAANVDLLLMVQAASDPPFQPGLVDRFVAAARKGRVTPALVINKADLVPAAEVEALAAPFRDAGLTVLIVSCRTGQGLAELRQALRDRISVLSGKSGVGKSSLVNALLPGVNVPTAEIIGRLRKGRHTTTTSRLYRLPDGGYLADTPGIRTFALEEEELEESLDEAFPEIADAARACRFRDCRHAGEPGCGVERALQAGNIREDRWRSYLRLRDRT